MLQTAAPRRQPGKTKKNPARAEQGAFLIDALSAAEKKLYAAAVVFHGNNTAAFRDVFDEAAVGMSGQMICYYARQLNGDEVVRGEVESILNARTDAKLSVAADKRRAAIEVVAKMTNIMRADHEEAVAAVIGQPVGAIEALPPHLRGVIGDWSVRENKDGEMIITGAKCRDPVKAAEMLARWVELSSRADSVGYSAESPAIDVFPSDGAGNVGSAPAGGAGAKGVSGETSAADIG